MEKVKKFFSSFAATLRGKFGSKEEIIKFAFLAVIFGLIIGIYWTLRPIKDSVFLSIVGKNHLWKVKIFSVLVIFPLVILYGKLIDAFARHRVFYGLVGTYAIATLLFSWGLMHPTIGILNTEASPLRFIGWTFYIFVESYGSLIVALFWAFVTDTTAPEAARRGFPFISLFGQIGNIVGPFILNTKRLGFSTSAPIVGIAGILMIILVATFVLFMAITPASQLAGYRGAGAHAKHKEGGEPGFLEGLKLLLTHGYLLGIFLIITFYEVVVGIIDNHFKLSVAETYCSEKLASAYLSNYAVWVGIIAFACILLGINNVQRILGMKSSLIILPILIGTAVIILYLYPSAIAVSFWLMVSLRAVNYALNQPVLKQLYIPTTPDTKYKAQAWLEMFGSRGSKAMASGYASYRVALGVPAYLLVTLFASGGIIAVWLFIATYVSRKYNNAIAKNEVVC